MKITRHIEIGNLMAESIKKQIGTVTPPPIEIAMVAAKKSQLTIFDEPEAGIDLWSFNNLINVFEKMKTTSNNTILAISHQERILNIADEIIVLKNGEILDTNSDNNLQNILSTNTIHCKKRN